MERFVHWLSYSRIRYVSRLFSGSPRLRLEAEPAVQERIIAKSEHRVYGPEGLVRFEECAPPKLGRLARRSLAQFLCQKALTTDRAVATIRLLGFATATPFLLAFLLVRSRWAKQKGLRPDEWSGAVVFRWVPHLEQFVWDGAFGEYPVVLYRDDYVRLGRAEMQFMGRTLKACPSMLVHPELLCHVLRWLAYYGYVVWALHPKIVANFSENTAASSLMTAYLAERNIVHCGIQHGEIIFSAYSAFAEFDEYRAWGPHFAEILGRQRSPLHRVVISGVPFHRKLFTQTRPAGQPRPPRLLFLDPFLHELEFDYTEDLLGLLARLDGTWEVKIRRHPADRRHSLEKLARCKSSPELARRGVRVEEERPETMPIEDALGRSRVVAGVCSSALLEAWVAGCKVLYMPGGASRSVVMDRHQGSPNVCYLADGGDLTRFLGDAAVLDDDESARIHHVTAVL